MVNAPHLAQERGIKVIESKVSRAEDFASCHHDAGAGVCVDRLIAGALFHGGQPRIVRIDDFMLEAIPEGPTILHPEPRPSPASWGTWSAHDARERRASTSRACSWRSCGSAVRPPCW